MIGGELAGDAAPLPLAGPPTGDQQPPKTGPLPSGGLTTAEARQRLARYGPNEVETGQRFSALRTVLQFAVEPARPDPAGREPRLGRCLARRSTPR